MPNTHEVEAPANRLKFEAELAKAYESLFISEDYAYVARSHTPQSLAATMTAKLADGSASKHGKGVRMACKAVGIRHTYKAIKSYLNQP